MAAIGDGFVGMRLAAKLVDARSRIFVGNRLIAAVQLANVADAMRRREALIMHLRVLCGMRSAAVVVNDPRDRIDVA